MIAGDFVGEIEKGLDEIKAKNPRSWASFGKKESLDQEPAESGAATPRPDLSGSKKRRFEVDGDFAERRRRAEEIQKRMDQVTAKTHRFWAGFGKKECRDQEAATPIHDDDDSKTDHAAKKRRKAVEDGFDVAGDKTDADEFNKRKKQQDSDYIRETIRQTVTMANNRQVSPADSIRETIRQTVTQRWDELAESFSSIRVALVERAKGLDEVERQLQLRSRDHQTRAAAIAERDSLQNKNAALERIIAAREKDSSEGSTVLQQTQQESESTAHQTAEEEQELKRVTKQVEDEDGDLGFVLGELAAVTRVSDEKERRLRSIETRLVTTKAKLHGTTKEKRALKLKLEDTDKQVTELEKALDYKKERYAGHLAKMDDKIRELILAKTSVHHLSTKF